MSLQSGADNGRNSLQGVKDPCYPWEKQENCLVRRDIARSQISKLRVRLKNTCVAVQVAQTRVNPNRWRLSSLHISTRPQWRIDPCYMHHQASVRGMCLVIYSYYILAKDQASDTCETLRYHLRILRSNSKSRVRSPKRGIQCHAVSLFSQTTSKLSPSLSVQTAFLIRFRMSFK